MTKRFHEVYLEEYAFNNESTTIHHRWSMLAVASALLGRRYYLPFGHRNIYPNVYFMLMGEPATRKSSAISLAEDLLKKTGYETIASGKTSAEKFLMDLAGIGKEEEEGATSHSIWEDDRSHEMMVVADEANNFFGLANYNFISTLGELWDCKQEQPVRFKNSSSFVIKEPFVTILSGNTKTNYALAFPPEIIGQGFFSRLLLIHADPSGRKITIPPPPPKEATEWLVERLKEMRLVVTGEAKFAPDAYAAIDAIYRKTPPIPDVRFQNYEGRRLTHLLKLCMLYAALELRTEILLEDVILANSTLCFAERRMPEALGEYGKSKNSDVAAKVMAVLTEATRPMTLKAIWGAGISNELEKLSQLAELLAGLKMADKIQEVSGGFLPKRQQVREEGQFVDFSLLLESKRN